MYVHAANAMLVTPQEDLAARRAQLNRSGVPLPRRLGRFGLLAMLGAHELLGAARLPSATGVYLATESGAAGDTEAVLDQVVAERSLPKPAHFIHTLSNTAAFYVARQYGLSGPNQTVSSRALSFERALDLARSDLHCGRACQALVGAVDEASRPPWAGPMEASCWLLASRRPAGAIGRLLGRIEAPRREEALERLAGIPCPPSARLHPGPLLAPEEIAWWSERLALALAPPAPDAEAACDAATAAALCRFIAAAQAPACLLYVNRDAAGRHSLTLLQRGGP